MNFIVTRQGLGQARPNKKQSQRGKNFRPQMPGHAADILHQAGVVRQAMIVVGKVLDTDYELSKLYDSKFTTMFRKGTDGE